MKYKNAQDILPDQLLRELQKYVSGETIYVPNQQGKKPWGETSGARSYYKQRKIGRASCRERVFTFV